MTTCFRTKRAVCRYRVHAALSCGRASAQQTNPVDRKVENPMTDTPNVNPLHQDQPVRPTAGDSSQAIQAGRRLTVGCCARETVSGPENDRVSVCEGNVDARIGTYRLQADKVTVYEATNRVVAEGNVVFDQGDQQRITGSRANGTTAPRPDSS